MRILHLDPDDIDNPLSGGGPVRTFEICRRLARRHEVTVATPTFPGSTPELVRDGVRYVRLGRRIGSHGSSHHFTFLFALPAFVRRSRFDLLVEDLMPPAAATINPLFSRQPVIASVQWFFAREWTARLGLPFHWGEQYGIRLYRNFVVLTHSMRERIEARVPGARCTVIPNGIDDSLFDLPIRAGRSILYAGRIDAEQKGVDLLLTAYARLARPRPPLVLAGHSQQPGVIEALARQLGVAGDIIWFGRYDRDARARLLADCRFVCVPSRDETFGMVITEACAAGKPVVYFDRPPMNEVAANAACEAVPPFAVDGYAEAMVRLWEAPDSELLRRGEMCRQAMTAFRWDTLAARQEDFYGEVADRPSLRAAVG